MPATKGKSIPGTDATVSQRPKTGKGVFPPPGTPDVEGDLYGLLDFILGPFMQGGESVHPMGAPNSGTVNPNAAPAPQTSAQPPAMAAQPTDTLQGQIVQPGATSPFTAANVFGDAFGGGIFDSPPIPARNPGFAPQMPAPNPFPGMHQPPQMAGAPPMPEMNPNLHDEERIKQMLGMLIGGGQNV